MFITCTKHVNQQRIGIKFEEILDLSSILLGVLIYFTVWQILNVKHGQSPEMEIM